MRLGKYEITAKPVITFLAAILVIFTLYCLAWLPPSAYIHRGFFLTICILLVALTNLPKSKLGKIFITIFTLMALTGSIYPVIFEDRMVAHLLLATETEIYIGIIFLIGFFAVLSRVSGGYALIVLTGIALVYMLWGHHLSGLFGHGYFPLGYIMTMLYTNISQGAFGTYAALGARLISIFIIFASLLLITGLGDLFTAFACRVAGNAAGGPAKVSVISSGLFGMISGSGSANVAATGSFTIPLMKRIGYKSSTAATVEALSSTGGQMMPPIMGLGAFIMADILGIPYLRVCLAAIIPAFCWYFTLYLIVHYHSFKERIKRWKPPHEEFMAVMRANFHLVFAVFALIGAVLYFGIAEQGAFWAVIFLLILTNLRKNTRLTKARVAEFLERYARMFGFLFMWLVSLGIFVGAVMGAGIPPKLGILIFGGIEQWYFILLIAGALTILLGMALPISAAYLTTAVIVAPLLGPLGVNLLLIHLVIFYVAIIAQITPPVCISSYTAARIAGSDMLKTALEATWRGLPLWIVPFIIFKRELLFGIGTPLSALGIGVAILCFGVFMFVLGSGGFFRRDLKLFERALACVTGIMILQPISDFYAKIFIVVGGVLLIYWYLPHLFGKAKFKRGLI